MTARRAPSRVWLHRGLAVLLAYVILAQALFASIARAVHAGEHSALPASAMVLCSGESVPGDASPDSERARDCLARCAAAMHMPVPLLPGDGASVASPDQLAPAASSQVSHQLRGTRQFQAFAPRAPPVSVTFA